MTRVRSALVGMATLLATLAVGCASSAESTDAAASTTTAAYAPGRHRVSIDVAGVTRTAVVVVPEEQSAPAPLVFVFHGHGGSGARMDRRIDIEGLWPEAIAVYPDGIPGHQGITDTAGVRPGWQTRLGESGDRDLAFFDRLFAELRSNLAVDPDRVYLMGHSNGSAFVSLLLNQRGEAIAATANLSAQPSARLLDTDPVRSMFMSIGRRDPLVPYANQVQSIPLAERKLGVDPSTGTVDGNLRSETGTGNLELATYIYPGGHAPPPQVPRLVVDFFQRHTRSDG